MLHVRANDVSMVQEAGIRRILLSEKDTQGLFRLETRRIYAHDEKEPYCDGPVTYCVIEGNSLFRYQSSGESPQTILARVGDIVHLPVQVRYTVEVAECTISSLLMLHVHADDSQQVQHIKIGDGKSLAVFTDIGTFKIIGEENAQTYLLMEWRVPSSGGPALHAQSTQETFYILQGTFTFRGLRAEETFIAGEGDVVHVPARVVHSYKNSSNFPGKILVLFTPAGSTQQFFEDIGFPITGGSSSSHAILPDPTKIALILQKYKDKVTIFPEP
jgi:quercetin dioxygenase-like cupin family protein